MGIINDGTAGWESQVYAPNIPSRRTPPILHLSQNFHELYF